MRTAIDTNVISALWSLEPSAPALSHQLGELRRSGGLVICAPVYAELLAHPRSSDEFVDEFLLATGITVDFSLSESVWREAGSAFARYAHRRRRERHETPRRLLVDFVIGAHAMEQSDSLMTLDRARYERDFPSLCLV